MNLLMDKWIPVLTRSGRSIRIAPWEVGQQGKDPPVELAFARSDFTGSMIQFLIGALQTVLMPENDDEWLRVYSAPPGPEELRKRLGVVSPAFDLMGDGPRFMQAFEEFDKPKTCSIDQLFIDNPGGKTIRQNKDLFVKRDRITSLCPACTAAALFTLQCNAPSGGRGHKTSIRGGGPMTTLLTGDTLWQTLWMNVLPRSVVEAIPGNWTLDGPEHVFPWLAPTRSKEVDASLGTTAPEDVHPLQVYWNMPRRIKIQFSRGHTGPCSLCGGQSDVQAEEYETRPNGVDYTSGVWEHPLSPYYRDRSGTWLPVHPQPGGIVYRHWMGLVEASKDEDHRPAMSVRHFRHELSDRLAIPGQTRIWAFGYDMDNMKARCWYESRMPYVEVESSSLPRFSAFTEGMVKLAEHASKTLRNCTKQAWVRRPGDAKGDMSVVTSQFWSDTESHFFSALNRLSSNVGDRARRAEIKDGWHAQVSKKASQIFDELVLSQPIEHSDPGRIARARQRLLGDLSGGKAKKLLKRMT